MSGPRHVRAMLALIVGSLLVGGEYWALLNVPESNVLALALSALLVVMMTLSAGVALGVASGFSQGLPPAEAGRRAIGALPLFFVGLLIFAALLFATTRFDAWWLQHRGEADAIALRYAGVTRTAPGHEALAWISWLLRWAVGLSMVIGLVAVATLRSPGQALGGLRVSLKLLPLAAAIAGVLLVTQLLWRVALWRPAQLPATSVEIVFAGMKLAVLYLVGTIIAAAVVSVYGRAATRA